MAKVKNPKRFSTEFHINPGLLKVAGSFDPLLNADTKLFIDPLLLEHSSQAEMKSAYADWEAHFRSIIKLLGASTNRGDVAWRAAQKNFDSPEFKGTSLGYGSGTIAGSGIGPELRDRLLATAHEIVRLGIDDPTLFPLLALLEDDVGPDRISDLTTRVIGKRLAQYTIRVLAKTDVAQHDFEIFGDRFQLPVNPYVKDRGQPLPVILTPQDVLRELPIASDWNDVDRVKSHNDALRRRVNEAIGAIWARHAPQGKAANRAAFMKSRDAFASLLLVAKAVPKDHYDFIGDPAGLANWLEFGTQLAAANPITLEIREQNKADVLRVVSEVVAHYKNAVENRDLWKSLYDSNNSPHHESYAQRLFYAMALSFCKANDVGIDPETNAGGGPVDFVMSRGFSARIPVELKLSTNGRLRHGYSEQLEIYKSAQESELGLFVILDVDGGSAKQIEAVLELERTAKNENGRHSEVIVVDAHRRLSASKR